MEGHQFVFWSAMKDFPMDYTAIHIWHKPNGSRAQHYERIFERRGQSICRVFRKGAINSAVSGQMARDAWTGHPSQKPVSLMLDLVDMTDGKVCDPFMGSGTTGVACMLRGRPFVGVELDKQFFDIACERIDNAQRQSRLFEDGMTQEDDDRFNRKWGPNGDWQKHG